MLEWSFLTCPWACTTKNRPGPKTASTGRGDTTFLLAREQQKTQRCDWLHKSVGVDKELCKYADVPRPQYSSYAAEGMCSLWTILDNNLKCIPPAMCKITHPQQIQPTGAFYEQGEGGHSFLFFSRRRFACNQICGCTSVSELLRKYFEMKQLLHCQRR